MRRLWAELNPGGSSRDSVNTKLGPAVPAWFKLKTRPWRISFGTRRWSKCRFLALSLSMRFVDSGLLVCLSFPIVLSRFNMLSSSPPPIDAQLSDAQVALLNGRSVELTAYPGLFKARLKALSDGWGHSFDIFSVGKGIVNDGHILLRNWKMLKLDMSLRPLSSLLLPVSNISALVEATISNHPFLKCWWPHFWRHHTICILNAVCVQVRTPAIPGDGTSLADPGRLQTSRN